LNETEVKAAQQDPEALRLAGQLQQIQTQLKKIDTKLRELNQREDEGDQVDAQVTNWTRTFRDKEAKKQ
jgi:hypothetical protein